MKLERLIAMVYKLLHHEVLSAAVLADEYGVSQRTIYRDIDVLCAAGFPVVSVLGQHGGYGIMDGYKMDKTLLGSYDVETLLTVLRSLSSVFEDERAQGTIERLQTISPNSDSVAGLAVNLETRRVDPEALPKLRTGVAERRVVRFDYVRADNQRTLRALEPLRLHYKHSNWYVYGFCRTRRDYREFRLSRMLDVRLTEENFAAHAEYSPDRPITVYNDDEHTCDVVFRVYPEALSGALDQFPQADKQFHADGSLTMGLRIHKPLEARWLWSILLGFGPGAEVLQPVELRFILREHLQKALLLYDGKKD
ncbi:YafY family protein [Saccharibacillus sacchari]|uniref:YafY family protein n=1 Tax=Saccharibacillus sacchari TaxID=456493 RepID=A0ACC6PJV8_9BACL